MSNKFNYEYYPEEITTALCSLADYESITTNILEQLEDCLYNLRAICENDLNSDYYRTTYKILESITENVEQNRIRKGM